MCARMPIIEHATRCPSIIERVYQSGADRLCIDLVDGSRGLNENEVDRIVKVIYEPVMVWGTLPTPTCTGRRFFVVSDDGERLEVDQAYAKLAASFLRGADA